MKCSFTGHRSITLSHRERLIPLLVRAIEYAYSEGCREFLSGGALGFDTLAAREVIRFKQTHPDVRLVMMLPCIDQDKSWSAGEREMYSYVLRNADETVYVNDEYTDRCMRERNFRLASECDLMIAYLGRRMSGAGQTVGMAERMGKRIYNLYPTLNNLS